MRSKWVGVTLSTLALSGCAGLMMDVKELDAKHENLALAAGDEVKLVEPDVRSVEEGFSREEAQQLRKLLKAELVRELNENKIRVVADSDKQISVRVTNYERGCGFCRGFFPVFGLGDSAVDGEVALLIDGRQRRLIVDKTGQATGMSQMGDQTATNVDYFATVVVARLTDVK